MLQPRSAFVDIIRIDIGGEQAQLGPADPAHAVYRNTEALEAAVDPDAVVGSALIDKSQKMTVAARATAEKKAFGHRS